MAMADDLSIRMAAFQWLSDMIDIHGDVLPRPLLTEGFQYQSERIPLMSPQGIFKPRIMDLPLTITTAPKGPYDDSFSAEGYLIYKYRGTDPNHRDNVGLRKLYRKQLPLIYFHGIIPGRYLAIWPVFIIGDDPADLSFTVAVDDVASVSLEPEVTSRVAEETGGRRAYVTANVRIRLHQRSFREKVLAAYRSQCAFCRLRHRELLDAAHIIPDSVSGSRPTVDNGLSLCKLHHAAFDSFMIGVTPDYELLVREDILAEDDGPMLLHGLQDLHGAKLILPATKNDWPNQGALEWRFERFRQVSI
jgi:putative restriction endonuclease